MVKEVIGTDRMSTSGNIDKFDFSSAAASCKINLNLPYANAPFGDSLSSIPPLAQKAFRLASKADMGNTFLDDLSRSNLTGLSLLYAKTSNMPPHYDSPTQPGNTSEWLVMFNLGASIHFRCDDSILEVKNGDAVVMDAMQVFHGVEGVLDSNISTLEVSKIIGLHDVCANGRLGVLLWKAQNSDVKSQTVDSVDSVMDNGGAFQNMFANSSDEDE